MLQCIDVDVQLTVGAMHFWWPEGPRKGDYEIGSPYETSREQEKLTGPRRSEEQRLRSKL